MEVADVGVAERHRQIPASDAAFDSGALHTLPILAEVVYHGQNPIRLLVMLVLIKVVLSNRNAAHLNYYSILIFIYS